MQYIRELYWRYEYEEVVTPNIFNFDLWKTSGHAEHYKDNMFLINIEKQEFGLKPMNCPGAPRLASQPAGLCPIVGRMPLSYLAYQAAARCLRVPLGRSQRVGSGVQRASPDVRALHALPHGTGIGACAGHCLTIGCAACQFMRV